MDQAIGGTATVRVAGKARVLPSVDVNGRTVVAVGTWLRTAVIKHEELAEGDVGLDVPRIIDAARRSSLRADIFGFSQKVTDPVPRHSFYWEPESWAVIRLTSFDEWWAGVPQETRKNVRRAGKRGITVAVVPFSDQLVRGIKDIYDETPVRQGRRFWHYGKDVETVASEMGTYLDRSDFVAAHLNGELVGFVKVSYVDDVATIMQILAKNAHNDARPINALLAQTVRLCIEKRMAALIYGQYVYGRHVNSPLTEFKRRNGFQEVTVPRYFVPLTAKGAVAIKFGIHTGIREVVPAPLINFLLRARARLYDLRMKHVR